MQNGSYTVDGNFDALADGETATITFQYTATDDSGTANAVSDAKTVTLTVTGSNDAPVVSSATNSAVEDGAVVTGSVAGTDLDDTIVSYTLVSTVSEGTLSFDTATGAYAFIPGAAFQDLAENETRNVSFSFKATDEHGDDSTTETVTITVTGTNDAPTATAATNSVDEDATITDGQITFGDVDGTATVKITDGNPTPTGLVLNSNGSYTFDASSYDSLTEGQQQVVVVPLTITDDKNATTTTTLTITITGTNDAPTATAATNSVDEDATITDGQITFGDVDGTATVKITDGNPTPTGLVLNSNGSYTFDASSYDSLAEGQQQDIVVPLTITDDKGATTMTTLTITITGTNDAPTVTANSNVENVHETDLSAASTSDLQNFTVDNNGNTTLETTVSTSSIDVTSIVTQLNSALVALLPGATSDNVTVTSEEISTDTYKVKVTIGDLPDNAAQELVENGIYLIVI